jgi:DNA-directed RNA polymerase specialized sigma subunit
MKSDEALVALARGGDAEAADEIVRRYRPVADRLARHFFLDGFEHEDLVQEGMIGLHKAVQGFEEGRHAAFQTFAALCIRRRILSAVRKSLRRRTAPPRREELVRALATRLTETEQRALKLWLEGAHERQIGRLAGIDDAAVPKVLGSVRQKVASILRD